jgi:hypothetical protein
MIRRKGTLIEVKERGGVLIVHYETKVSIVKCKRAECEG